MTGFDLPTNYIEDLEALIKRTRAKLKKVSALESEDNQTRWSLTLEFKAMANNTCRRTNQFIRAQVQWQPASGRTVILEPI